MPILGVVFFGLVVLLACSNCVGKVLEDEGVVARTTTVGQAEPGMCLDVPPRSEAESVDIVACDGPHQAEVVARLIVPAMPVGYEKAGEVIADVAMKCPAQLNADFRGQVEAGTARLYDFRPTTGGRPVICVVAAVDAGRPLIGSAG